MFAALGSIQHDNSSVRLLKYPLRRGSFLLERSALLAFLFR
jgi:hypothetical protein